MCCLCEQIRKEPPRNDSDRRIALDAIASAARSRGAEHFKPILDSLLGQELAEEDPEAGAAWERRYRRD